MFLMYLPVGPKIMFYILKNTGVHAKNLSCLENLHTEVTHTYVDV